MFPETRLHAVLFARWQMTAVTAAVGQAHCVVQRRVLGGELAVRVSGDAHRSAAPDVEADGGAGAYPAVTVVAGISTERGQAGVLEGEGECVGAAGARVLRVAGMINCSW